MTSTYCRGSRWETLHDRDGSAAKGTRGSYHVAVGWGCADERQLDAVERVVQLAHEPRLQLGIGQRGSVDCGQLEPFRVCA